MGMIKHSTPEAQKAYFDEVEGALISFYEAGGSRNILTINAPYTFVEVVGECFACNAVMGTRPGDELDPPLNTEQLEALSALGLEEGDVLLEVSVDVGTEETRRATAEKALAILDACGVDVSVVEIDLALGNKC